MIKANFNTYAKYVTDSLYQWDINRTLSVSGLNLSVAPEVHFSNSAMDKAIVRQATLLNNIVSVKIPNSILQYPLTVNTHIGVYEGDEFKVLEVISIPVIPKAKPSDYKLENSDEEVYSFNRLENMIEQIDEKWSAFTLATVDSAVKAWLDSHPEATTTVQDGALTEAKFSDELKLHTIKDYVTPQMFGAKGDGVTDDTNALQHAINSSDTIFIPNGVYLISGLTISKPIRIIGLSKTNTVLKYTGVDTALIFKPDIVTTSDEFLRVEVENIKLVGDGGKSAIFMNETVHSVFKNILINGNFVNGFEMNGESNLVSRQNTIYNNHFEEITIKNCDYGFNIFGCISDSHFNLISMMRVEKGVYIHGDYNTQGINNVTFTNSTIVWSKVGFEINGCHFRNLHISGCNFELFDNNGIKIDPNNSDIKNVSIVNSFFMPSTKATTDTICIRLNKVTGGIINNLLFQNTISGVKGVDTTGSLLLHVDSLVTNNGSTINHTISKACYYHSYEYDNNLDTQILNVGFKVPRITTTGGAVLLDGDKRLSLNFENGNLLSTVDGKNCYILSCLGDNVIKSLDNVKAGSCIMNDTLKKPVFYTGSKWVDAMGNDI